MKGFRTLAWSLFMALFPVFTTWLGGVDWVSTLRDFGLPEQWIMPAAGAVAGLVTFVLRWLTTTPVFKDEA